MKKTNKFCKLRTNFDMWQVKDNRRQRKPVSGLEKSKVRVAQTTFRFNLTLNGYETASVTSVTISSMIDVVTFKNIPSGRYNAQILGAASNNVNILWGMLNLNVSTSGSATASSINIYINNLKNQSVNVNTLVGTMLLLKV